MTLYQQQKTLTLVLLERAHEVARRLENEDAKDSLKAEMERLTNDELNVVVAGEFKRGKSTLLNNLLGRPYCPVDIAITTAVATLIRFGERERVTIHYSNAEGTFQQKEIPADEIPLYASEEHNRQNQLQVRLVEIEAPLPTLIDRIAFFDTPGVGGMNTIHSEVTVRALMKADAVLYVFDATSPLSKTETEFIEKRLADKAEVLFVMTKKDLVAQPDEVARDNARKFAKITSRPVEAVTVIPVNNLAYESHLKTSDREDLNRSNLETLRSQLWESLRSHRGSIMIGRALAGLENGVERMEMPLRIEAEALNKANAEATQKQKLRLEDEKKRREELLSNHSQWLSTLSQEMALLTNNLRASLEQKFINTTQKLQESVQQQRYREDPERLEALLNEDLVTISSSVEDELGTEISRIYSLLASQTKLEFTKLEPEFDPGLRLYAPETVEYRKRSSLNKMMEKLKSATGYGVAGGILSSILGLGPLGLLVGVAGAIHGWQEAKERMEQQQSAEVARVLLLHFNNELHSARVEFNRGLTELLTRTDRTLRDEIQGLVRREHKMIDESLAALTRAAKASDEENHLRLSKLVEPLKELQEIRKAAAPLATVLRPTSQRKRSAATPLN